MEELISVASRKRLSFFLEFCNRKGPIFRVNLALDIFSTQLEWVLCLGMDCDHVSAMLSSYFFNGARPGNHIHQIWYRVLVLFYFLKGIGWRSGADIIIEEGRLQVTSRFHFVHYF